MSIRVNTDTLNDKAAYAASLASDLKEKEQQLRNIYYNLDSKVKSRQSIDYKLRSLQNRLESTYERMHKLGNFLSSTASRYESAEKKVVTNLSSLNGLPAVKAAGTSQAVSWIAKWLQNNFSNIVVGAAAAVGFAAAPELVLAGAAAGAVVGAAKGLFAKDSNKTEATIKGIPGSGLILSKDIIGKNEYVLKLQQRLNELKYTVKENGVFDDETERAVNEFKKNNKLANYGEYEGKVGETTWLALFSAIPGGIAGSQKGSSQSSKKSSTTTEVTGKINNVTDKTAIETIINNLTNNTSLHLSKMKKESMIGMAKVLLNEGYEPAFVAGILGNVLAEGTIGAFESSNYIKNPEPAYLQHLDNNYNYRQEFSGKNIMQVGIAKTYDLLQSIKTEDRNNDGKIDNQIGKFGLGCVQWTGGRTDTLIECYKEVCKGSDKPSLEQCIQAESMCLVKELKGNHNDVYNDWLSQYSDKDNAAYYAGRIVCKEYERPKVDTSNNRGNRSLEIYNVMMDLK